jgi:dTDP-4-amino-4,6-dideoxygalactose transaminase
MRRVEVDCEPDTGAPIWPLDRDALIIAEHRHAIPVSPPEGASPIRVLEDATTALGGAVRERPVGGFGQAVVVSFGTALCPRSSGALIATARPPIFESLRAESALIPLEDVADVAVRADLAEVADRIEAFQAAGAVYDSAWRGKDLDLSVVQPSEGTISCRCEYMIRVPDPDGLAATLAREGVEARRPQNARLHGLLADPIRSFPGARAFYSTTLQLPSHPGLDVGELLFIADVVVGHLGRTSA